MRAGHLFPDSSHLQGLVIDDFYAISIEPPGSDPEASRAVKSLEVAATAYAKYELLGSTEKDVRGAEVAKVAGIEIDSSSRSRALGVVPAGAPRAKRLSLASLTLSVAALPSTTDTLHSCLMGGWTSVLIYRRPIMAVLSQAFRVYRADQLDPSRPKVLPLSRRVADELALCAALAPLAASDLAAPWDPVLYATDSSDSRAAIVSARIPEELSRALWRGSDRKGATTKLLSRAQACLKKADPFFEEDLGDDVWGGGAKEHWAPWPSTSCSPCPRPVGFRFHFLQFGSTSSYIPDCLSSRGWSVGPVLDPALSPHYDLCEDLFLLWLLHLLEAGKLDSLLISLPGSDCSSPKVARENITMHRALLLFSVSLRLGIPCMMTQPGASIAPSLPAWVALTKKDDVTQLRMPSALGRSLVLLVHGLPARALLASPPGFDSRAQAGDDGAVLPWAGAISEAFSQGLRRLIEARSRHETEPFGLESVLVDGLAQSLEWKLVAAWNWRRERHINVHETGAYKHLCMRKPEDLFRVGLLL